MTASRALGDRARILEALDAAGVRTATSGKMTAPVVVVEPGDPWTEPRRLPGRVTRWRLTAYAGKADTEGSLAELGELVDRIDAALRKVQGCELPTWAKPADYTLDGAARAGSVGTIEISTIE
jgi:sugar phosphate isomerase/epimerase